MGDAVILSPKEAGIAPAQVPSCQDSSKVGLPPFLLLLRSIPLSVARQVSDQRIAPYGSGWRFLQEAVLDALRVVQIVLIAHVGRYSLCGQ